MQAARLGVSMDLVRTYRMYQKMMHYPKLLPEMRRLFLQALEDRGIARAEIIRQEAQERLPAVGPSLGEEEVEEYYKALIDLYFANHFSEEETENYINLARKMERFRYLNRVVNMEGATSMQIKRALKAFCEIPEGDLYIPPNEAIGTRVALINHFISNQLPFIGIAKSHITIRDIDDLCNQSYWSRRRSGRIGGKAAGMFLAYKIVLPRLARRDPELEKHVIIPESFYFNSGIFSEFLDYNELHGFHSQKYKTRESIEEEYKSLGRLFEKASFPPDVVEHFREFLEKVGEHPLILRSSSFLEDNFGYAFSGKYDSVFLANQGDPEARLNQFIWGLKRVHMSTFGPAPILYRRDHNLLDFDEKMSVLVQKVAGRRWGDHFFPFAAGVAYSRNTYRWTQRIKMEEGLVRLVMGLGTRAVDRVAGDYPRMVALSHPMMRPEVSPEQIRKYSQKMVDVLNLRENRITTLSYRDLLREVDHPEAPDALSVYQDGHMASPMFRSQRIDPDQSCITFERFLTRTRFVGMMKRILSRLEQAYGRPVDIEFAWDDGRLYLLQCRTLAVQQDAPTINLPKDVTPEQTIFTNNRGVSNGAIRDIEYVVYVDPKAYGRLDTYDEKLGVGRIVSRLNRLLDGKRYALFGPGRWGSNDINLGVRVGYEDINRTQILAEIAFEERGATPEVSYGTHFFNDLVEARIVPIAIYPDQENTVFKETFFLGSPSVLSALLPDLKASTPVVRVIHVPACAQGRYLQVFQDADGQEGIGFLGPAQQEDRQGESGK
jgi:hypothetical protein